MKNLCEVTKEEFYAKMCGEDVHPTIINNYDYHPKHNNNRCYTGLGKGYIAEWKTRAGRIIGVSETGDFPFTEPKYFLPS